MAMEAADLARHEQTVFYEEEKVSRRFYRISNRKRFKCLTVLLMMVFPTQQK